MERDAIIERFRRWVAGSPALPADDARTLAFCRRRLHELAEPGLLEEKWRREIGDRAWEPLGNMLVVIAEHDVLGTMLGVIGALVTGNHVRIKARMTKALVTDLVRALEVDCEIADWSSTDQDDRAVLDGIDGVLLAGGAELIAHYRRIAPVDVRLVEFGPKLSCAAIGRAPGDLDRLADALIADVTLFRQGVCSSPQWIFVEDVATAEALRAKILARELPPLPDDDARVQRLRARELALHARLGDDVKVDVHASGWGVTIARSMRRLPKGFAFVVGPVGVTRQLQVLGVAGDVPEVRGFVHRCPIGRMHERSPLAPHDGLFELAALVRFTSRDEGAP